MELERAQQLLMAHIDGELLPAEREELETALRDSPALRRELQRWEALSGQLSRFRLRDPGDAVLEDLERNVMARTGMHVGWLLLGGGALLLFAFAVQAVLRDPGLPAVFRLSAGGLLAGLVLLFGLKVRERWIERRHDPYRYVVR
jgi:anti-sigma factor RsiW